MRADLLAGLVVLGLCLYGMVQYARAHARSERMRQTPYVFDETDEAGA